MRSLPFTLCAAWVLAPGCSTPVAPEATPGVDGFVITGDVPAGVDIRSHFERLPAGGFGVVADPGTGEVATITRTGSPFARVASGEFRIAVDATCPDCVDPTCQVLQRTVEITLHQQSGASGLDYRMNPYSWWNFSSPTYDPNQWTSAVGADVVLSTTGTLGSCAPFSYYFDVVEVDACDPAVELLVNGGFESLSDDEANDPIYRVEGVVPGPWQPLAATPDTYSTDDTFGLFPPDWDNFESTIQAFEGVRFVAGWAAAGESFGQVLSSPLEPGATYRISGHLHRGNRIDHQVPSTYTVDLRSSLNLVDIEDVGTFATVDVEAWTYRELTFVAPADAAQRDMIALRSVSGYAGIDGLSLTRVCP